MNKMTIVKQVLDDIINMVVWMHEEPSKEEQMALQKAKEDI